MPRYRLLLAAGCVAALGVAAWLSNAETSKPTGPGWAEIAPGLLRTTEPPYGYALVQDGHAMLIDCPIPGDALRLKGVTDIDGVLLTHHHRDTVGGVGWFLDKNFPVRAAKA